MAMHIACFDTMKDYPITKIPKLLISHNQVQQLCRELIAVAMIISFSLGGGGHSHTFWIFSDDSYRTFWGKNDIVVSAQDTSSPDNNLGLLDNDSSGIINKKTAEWAGKKSPYFGK